MSVDYGFKISQPGYDVETALDSQLVVSSKANSLKIQDTLQGATSFFVSNGGPTVLTINHFLGYIPAYEAWYKSNDGIYRSIFENARLHPNSIIVDAVGEEQIADVTTIKIRLHNFTGVAHTIPVYYIIFLDPGA